MAFTMFAIGANLNLLYICHIGKTLEKAHASAHNIVDQQHATLLGPTCCVRLRGTTTMLVLVAYI